MSYLINIEIAGINFSISCRDLTILQDYDPAYKSFLKTERDPLAVDINIDLELNNIPDTKRLTKIFDSGQSWSLFLNNDDYFLVLNPPAFNNQPIWIAQFNRDITKATVYCSKMLINENEGNTVSNPVRYPMDQLLLMYALTQKHGAVLHAAGIGINNKGYIFAGRSGAGKSTLSRQFAAKKYPVLLSDDRVVIRKIDKAFMTFGTPWPGEEGIAINKSIPLSGIFFISHGSDNKIKEIDKKEALERLLPVTSIPWYDQEIMTKILNFCEDMISHIPAYELYFKPDVEVVDVLEKFASA
jgi:hypothetical protein